MERYEGWEVWSRGWGSIARVKSSTDVSRNGGVRSGGTVSSVRNMWLRDVRESDSRL